MVSATRRGFLRTSLTSAGAAVVAAGSPGCGHRGATVRGETPPSITEVPERDTIEIATTVNRQAQTLRIDPEQSALQLVRDRLGLTGSKLACGHGACGACTIQLDGTPVAACLLPATALHKKKVTTIEGIGSGQRLHPVQRAFMGQDALQCGYCTPGFIVEASAFVDRHRKAHGDVAPERDAIAAALSGHLCRCGAYDQIYAAVAKACEGAYDQDVAPEHASPRYEARAKVTGRAEYTVDVTYPDMLVAKALHAAVANAEVERLDWSAALAHPGVHGAIDLLGEHRRIRYVGQEIMALAAVDERTADEALALVKVEYGKQPPAIGIDAALDPSAAPVYRSRAEKHKPPNAAEAPLFPEPWKGNLRGPLSLLSKKPRAAGRAIARARAEGRLVEDTFTTSAQCHTCLEPHAAVAKWDGGQLTVHLSTQAVRGMASDIAEHFDLSPRDVKVIAAYVGGGFGSKATLQRESIIAIELARLTRRPVRYALDRRQEIMIGGYRPATSIAMKLATDADGEMTGMRAMIHSDSGVAVGHVVGIMFRLIYPVAPRELIDYDVLTHAPPGKPFRGPGGPMAFFALESAIDELAHRRDEDPIAVRRRWDPNPVRGRLYDWAQALPIWQARAKAGTEKGRYRRGVGLACAAWFAFAEPKSRVQVTAGRDGVRVRQGTQDMGNGSRTVLANAIGRELGIAAHEIKVTIGDSALAHGPMAGGSRSTSSIVPACIDACNELKEKLVEVAERTLGLRKAKVGSDGIEHAEGTMPWREVIAQSDPITVVGKRRRDEGGYFLPPIMGLATERAVTVSTTLAHVEVDTRLGRVRVLESWGGFGAGKIIAPTLARSQATGGIVQALGYTLYEERRLDPREGYLLTGGLEDYRLPGIGDVGPIHVHFDEGGFDKIRGRSLGIGELVTLAPAAAVANAVFNATGWRPRELPIRPDRVLAGLKG